jgi:hypothetical protein
VSGEAATTIFCQELVPSSSWQLVAVEAAKCFAMPLLGGVVITVHPEKLLMVSFDWRATGQRSHCND